MTARRYTVKDAQRALERMAERKGWTLTDPSWGIHDPRREDSVHLERGYANLVTVAQYVKDSPPRGDDPRPQAFTAIRTIGMSMTVREFCEREMFCRDMDTLRR